MAEIQSEVEDASELKFGPIFDKDEAQTLSNSEALEILNQTQQVRKTEDASYVPIPMVQQTRQYLERFNSVKSLAGLSGMRTTMQEAGVKPFEVCSIINLLPGSAEEAKKLIPSLEIVDARFVDDDQLKALLDRVQALKDI